MARMPRIVIPNIPHHVTQRGNGRAQVFFSEQDYILYRDLLAHHCRKAGVGVWAWVLMPNHVHLILTPEDSDGIRRALAPVHRAYAGIIHSRLNRTGHFWQGRFGCVAMDEPHLAAALRYLALNPVRARLAKKPTGWKWSSVHAQLGRRRRDPLTDPAPVRERYPDFAALIAEEEDEGMTGNLRRAETIGRPVGNPDFLARLEKATGKKLRAGKRGPRGGDER